MGRRKHSPGRKPQGSGKAGTPGKEGAEAYWIYGYHAVMAALANPDRHIGRFLCCETPARRKRLPAGAPEPQIVSRHELEQLLPSNAVHQGFAVETRSLPKKDLNDVLAVGEVGRRRVVVLDQINDPRNVGAMLRSAAAFDVDALLLTQRHAPPESGALAKAASGALETIPIVRVPNLAQALEAMARAGFWRIGMDADAEDVLTDVDLTGDLAIVFGAEGSGLRRLTAARCDILARLPMGPKIASLNVSNAAAITLFLVYQGLSDG